MNHSDTSVKPASNCPTYYFLSRREKYVWGLEPSPRLVCHPEPVEGSLKWSEVFCNTFKAMRARLGCCGSWVERSRSDNSDLCHEMTTRYGFTEEQMHRAAERFRLGRSKSGKTIYWMIDEMGNWQDGHIGTSLAPETWVSTLLKQRYREAAPYLHFNHCLFGLHQILIESKAIGIVKSAQSAVLLSEIYPKLIWMAYIFDTEFTEYSLKPLQGHKITLYPNVDNCLGTYLSFLDLADRARRKFHLDVTVSSFLEDHATEEQKARGIDLVDFLFA